MQACFGAAGALAAPSERVPENLDYTTIAEAVTLAYAVGAALAGAR